MTEENQETQSKLTKVKHPGRVESGKKLAEWNRNNKKALKQQPGQVPAQELQQEPESTTSLSTSASPSSGVKSSHILMFFAGIGAFFGSAYILKNRATTQAEPKAESKAKIFDPWRCCKC